MYDIMECGATVFSFDYRHAEILIKKKNFPAAQT